MKTPPPAANEDEARRAAVYYVRKLLARGYTEAQAAKEAYSGYFAPGESGYEIIHGRIQIPDAWDGSSRPKRWIFSFAKLAEEAACPKPQQLSLAL